MSTAPNKILVVSVNWIGDVIFSTPVYRALKEHYPDSQVCAMAVPRVRELLKHCPYVDRVLVYDEAGEHRSLFSKIRFASALAREKFDLAFLLRPSFSRAWLLRQAGIRQRIGYAGDKSSSVLTHVVAPSTDGLHRMDEYLSVIISYGVSVRDKTCALAVSVEEQNSIQGILHERGVMAKDRVVVLNPGGNWDLKRWPVSNWAQLIQNITAASGGKIVLSGAEKDKGLIQDIIASSGIHSVNLAGTLGISELLALMNRADVVVSADTGPLHIAASMGTDVVGIFGPTRPEITGPRGSGKVVLFQQDVGCNRAPCYYLECPNNVCMQAVLPDKVSDAVLNFLK